MQFGDAFLGGPIWICAILQNAFLGRMHFWDGAMLDILDTCNSTPRRVRVRGHVIVRVHRGRSVSDVESILEVVQSVSILGIFTGYSALP